jgi:hypothetical protein
MSYNTSTKKFYALSTILPNIPQDYSNGVTIPFKSFTSEDMYIVNITLNKKTLKWKFECNCGTKFNIGKRIKCKHISYIIFSMLEELNSPEINEEGLELSKSFEELGI